MMGYGSEGSWLFMLIPTVLLFSAIALGVWAAVSTTGTREMKPEPGAGSILEQRYAKGEISKAEFDEARRMLGLA